MDPSISSSPIYIILHLSFFLLQKSNLYLNGANPLQNPSPISQDPNPSQEEPPPLAPVLPPLLQPRQIQRIGDGGSDRDRARIRTRVRIGGGDGGGDTRGVEEAGGCDPGHHREEELPLLAPVRPGLLLLGPAHGEEGHGGVRTHREDLLERAAALRGGDHVAHLLPRVAFLRILPRGNFTSSTEEELEECCGSI